MVERPIKKSERQSQASTDNNSDSQPAFESNPKRERSSRDRSSGKRKKESFKDEAPPVNPALARPPKPAKPPVIVKSEPEPEAETSSEPIAEDSQES
ncbi:hypothetical protein H6G76_27940 [Nostoc sp. FACHB-152]|uniref:hypothetical protein n=1 Tax=unclassified Nostoc TaxID=2593658 RepID=UPI001683A76E|nr:MULTISPECIES: hypothetical protein [unclassified Nostoc]MBD2450891.1 hypothetical protein [Nostoc sp. FACHB-152]MBD2470072.1 hypothetical protein [Nostoc sp. FACHB-145]